MNVSNNSVFGTGRGGAITAYVPSEGLDLKLQRVTLAENDGSARGGAVDMSGLGGVGRLVMNKVAVLDNFAGGFGGGVFTQSDAKITDSVFDGNSLFGQSQDSAQGGGFYSNSGNAVQANSVRFNRTSVTNNELTATASQQGAGIHTSGVDLSLVNTTVSGNSHTLRAVMEAGCSPHRTEMRTEASTSTSRRSARTPQAQARPMGTRFTRTSSTTRHRSPRR